MNESDKPISCQPLVTVPSQVDSVQAPAAAQAYVPRSTNALNIPIVHPMMVRKFTPCEATWQIGGSMIFMSYDIEEIGIADTRLDYDEDVVDCSNRIFEITTKMMMFPKRDLAWTVFTSRRWRNFREGINITALPSPELPLLFIGNPVRLIKNHEGIQVYRSSEYLIRSGCSLQ